MHKTTASLLMSLDGVDAPHEWHFPYEAWLPFWPSQGTGNPMAAFFNTTPKLVASTSLDTLEWAGCTLIDELRLMIHPIVVGRGKRLFEDGGQPQGHELVESTVFGSGVLNLIYRPAG